MKCNIWFLLLKKTLPPPHPLHSFAVNWILSSLYFRVSSSLRNFLSSRFYLFDLSGNILKMAQVVFISFLKSLGPRELPPTGHSRKQTVNECSAQKRLMHPPVWLGLSRLHSVTAR
jgi:hypothetical protein